MKKIASNRSQQYMHPVVFFHRLFCTAYWYVLVFRGIVLNKLGGLLDKKRKRLSFCNKL